MSQRQAIDKQRGLIITVIMPGRLIQPESMETLTSGNLRSAQNSMYEQRGLSSVRTSRVV